eukprot:SAG22_NODE_6738_length_817_cov_2.174095_1_plen_86_part_00
MIRRCPQIQPGDPAVVAGDPPPPADVGAVDPVAFLSRHKHHPEQQRVPVGIGDPLTLRPGGEQQAERGAQKAAPQIFCPTKTLLV